MFIVGTFLSVSETARLANFIVAAPGRNIAAAGNRAHMSPMKAAGVASVEISKLIISYGLLVKSVNVSMMQASSGFRPRILQRNWS